MAKRPKGSTLNVPEALNGRLGKRIEKLARERNMTPEEFIRQTLARIDASIEQMLKKPTIH